MMKQLVHRPNIDGARCAALCDCLGTAKFVTWKQELRAVIACSLTQLKHLFGCSMLCFVWCPYFGNLTARLS